MRLVFLDVDGVVNSGAWRASAGARRPWPLSHFDPRGVELVDELCDRTDARVVVSSSWRLGRTVVDLQALFAHVGLRAPVVCKTATNPRGRGYEVQDWLEAGPRVESFVILDDMESMAPLDAHFVRTDSHFGIARRDVERAVRVALAPPAWRRVG